MTAGLDVAAAWRSIRVHGPSRVIVNDQAEAKSPVRASKQDGVTWDVVFVRGDGWSLGAPEELEAVAFETWAGHWVGFARRGEDRIQAMLHYTPPTVE